MRHGSSWLDRMTGRRVLGTLLLLVTLASGVTAVAEDHSTGQSAEKAKVAAGQAKAAARRVAADEFCVAQWITASAQRSRTLAPIAARRTNADNRRTNAIGREQLLFAKSANPKLSAAGHKRIVTQFLKALRDYGRADAEYKLADAEYKKADAAYPVPTLNLRCADKRFRVHVTPTPTKTVTAHATATRTMTAHSTQIVGVPGAVTTRTVTAHSTVTVTKNHTKTKTRTRTVPAKCPRGKLCITLPGVGG